MSDPGHGGGPISSTDGVSPTVLAATFAGACAIVAVMLGLFARREMPDPREVPIISSEGRLFFVLGLVAMAGIGFQIHRLFDRPVPHYTPYAPLPTTWILPTLTLMGGLLLVARYHDLGIVLMSGLLVGSGVFASLTVRQQIDEGNDSTLQVAQVIHTALTLGVGFIVLALVLLYRTRTLLSVPVVLLIATLLLLQVHDGIRAYPIRRAAYAVVGGIAVAELVWPLSYWPPSGWVSGALLTTVLLLYTLISRAHLQRRLNQAVALQYSGVCAVLFATIAACVTQ